MVLILVTGVYFESLKTRCRGVVLLCCESLHSMCAIGSEAWFPVMPSILLTWSRYGSFAELPGRCCVTEAGGAGVEMRLVGCSGLAVSRLVTAAGIIMVATLPKPMVPTISNKAYFIERYFWPDRILSGASSQSAFMLPILPDPESIARSIQHWALKAEHICDVGYRHAGAALCHRLSQSPSQSGMPIKPGHTLQVASASSTVQTIECQVEKHRQAQHGKIPD